MGSWKNNRYRSPVRSSYTSSLSSGTPLSFYGFSPSSYGVSSGYSSRSRLYSPSSTYIPSYSSSGYGSSSYSYISRYRDTSWSSYYTSTPRNDWYEAYRPTVRKRPSFSSDYTPSSSRRSSAATVSPSQSTSQSKRGTINRQRKTIKFLDPRRKDSIPLDLNLIRKLSDAIGDPSKDDDASSETNQIPSDNSTDLAPELETGTKNEAPVESKSLSSSDAAAEDKCEERHSRPRRRSRDAAAHHDKRGKRVSIEITDVICEEEEKLKKNDLCTNHNTESHPGVAMDASNICDKTSELGTSEFSTSTNHHPAAVCSDSTPETNAKTSGVSEKITRTEVTGDGASSAQQQHSSDPQGKPSSAGRTRARKALEQEEKSHCETILESVGDELPTFGLKLESKGVAVVEKLPGKNGAEAPRVRVRKKEVVSKGTPASPVEVLGEKPLVQVRMRDSSSETLSSDAVKMEQPAQSSDSVTTTLPKEPSPMVGETLPEKNLQNARKTGKPQAMKTGIKSDAGKSSAQGKIPSGSKADSKLPVDDTTETASQKTGKTDSDKTVTRTQVEFDPAPQQKPTEKRPGKRTKSAVEDPKKLPPVEKTISDTPHERETRSRSETAEAFRGDIVVSEKEKAGTGNTGSNPTASTTSINAVAVPQPVADAENKPEAKTKNLPKGKTDPKVTVKLKTECEPIAHAGPERDTPARTDEVKESQKEESTAHRAEKSEIILDTRPKLGNGRAKTKIEHKKSEVPLEGRAEKVKSADSCSSEAPKQLGPQCDQSDSKTSSTTTQTEKKTGAAKKDTAAQSSDTKSEGRVEPPKTESEALSAKSGKPAVKKGQKKSEIPPLKKDELTGVDENLVPLAGVIDLPPGKSGSKQAAIRATDSKEESLPVVSNDKHQESPETNKVAAQKDDTTFPSTIKKKGDGGSGATPKKKQGENSSTGSSAVKNKIIQKLESTAESKSHAASSNEKKADVAPQPGKMGSNKKDQSIEERSQDERSTTKVKKQEDKGIIPKLPKDLLVGTESSEEKSSAVSKAKESKQKATETKQPEENSSVLLQASTEDPVPSNDKKDIPGLSVEAKAAKTEKPRGKPPKDTKAQDKRSGEIEVQDLLPRNANTQDVRPKDSRLDNVRPPQPEVQASSDIATRSKAAQSRETASTGEVSHLVSPEQVKPKKKQGAKVQTLQKPETETGTKGTALGASPTAAEKKKTAENTVAHPAPVIPSEACKQATPSASDIEKPGQTKETDKKSDGATRMPVGQAERKAEKLKKGAEQRDKSDASISDPADRKVTSEAIHAAPAQNTESQSNAMTTEPGSGTKKPKKTEGDKGVPEVSLGPDSRKEVLSTDKPDKQKISESSLQDPKNADLGGTQPRPQEHQPEIRQTMAELLDRVDEIPKAIDVPVSKPVPEEQTIDEKESVHVVKKRVSGVMRLDLVHSASIDCLLPVKDDSSERTKSKSKSPPDIPKKPQLSPEVRAAIQKQPAFSDEMQYIPKSEKHSRKAHSEAESVDEDEDAKSFKDSLTDEVVAVKPPRSVPAPEVRRSSSGGLTKDQQHALEARLQRAHTNEKSVVERRATEEIIRNKSSDQPAVIRFRKYSLVDFRLLKVLGKGSFGKVFLVELRDVPIYFAMKCLKKDVVLEDDDVECTLVERQVLSLGSHNPFICKLFCTFQTDSHLFFVMEFLRGGDLMFHVQNEGSFTEDRARFYGAEIVCALKFLHRRGIVYRDLKLDNVCLDGEGHIRLIDFGMCVPRVYRYEPTAFCGTPEYMAPEVIEGKHYNYAVDWWSFGVVMYEMLRGRSPYTGCDEDELFWNVFNTEVEYPKYFTREAKDLIQSLLQRDPERRLGMPESGRGDIKDHSFFYGINWSHVEKKQMTPQFRPFNQGANDVSNFDEDFTKEPAVLTPVAEDVLATMDQELFREFSYTNPNMTT